MTKNERLMVIELTQAVAKLGVAVGDLSKVLPTEEDKRASRDQLESVQAHLREVIARMGQEWS